MSTLSQTVANYLGVKHKTISEFAIELSSLHAGIVHHRRAIDGTCLIHRLVIKGLHGWLLILMSKEYTNVNATTEDGMTPLMIAAHLRHNECLVSLLDKRNCDRNMMDRRGRTALHHAVIGGNPEAINRLLLYKATDPCAKDLCSVTPVLLATTLKQVFCLYILLKNDKAREEYLEWKVRTESLIHTITQLEEEEEEDYENIQPGPTQKRQRSQSERSRFPIVVPLPPLLDKDKLTDTVCSSSSTVVKKEFEPSLAVYNDTTSEDDDDVLEDDDDEDITSSSDIYPLTQPTGPCLVGELEYTTPSTVSFPLKDSR